MKRIGVVTWYGGSNYGTSLQAYALCFALSLLGVEPFLLKKHMTWRNLFGKWRRMLQEDKKKSALMGYAPAKKAKIEKFKKEHFKQFCQCYGKIGKLLYARQIKSLNCVISGSDQLWNPYHTEPFLLLEGLETKKYSYASSFGVEEIPQDKKGMYRHALASFVDISVREMQGKVIVRELMNREVEKVLDPTFLLNRQQWELFAEQSELRDFSMRPYLLCYFVAGQEHYWEKVEEVKKKTGIERTVVLPMHPSHFRKNAEIIENAGIVDFVYLIKNATMICTDSFHATALSINLEKNFVTLLRFSHGEKKSQNSRLEDLLSRYDLLNRLWTGRIPDCSPIDYIGVGERIDEDRQHSVGYLSMIVESC